jgi:endonuclease I
MKTPRTRIKFMLAVVAAGLFNISAAAQGPNDSGDYYQAANGKSGAELKTALSQIIYNRTERSYKDLWADFRSTDARPDGKVWDMYSGSSNFTFGTDQAGTYKVEGDAYNREHSFPKSWFGASKKEIPPMYTDLFHLYPTDGYVNGMRSNYPFGETKGESYTSKGGFSKLGACTWPGYTGKVFEPNDEYKGDFARTYFYMVTCYEDKLPDWYNNNDDAKPTLDGNTYPGLSAWQLEMLLTWAAKDPVSEKETNRNNAVYDIQHNRNPFIDYPGLEQYIWGDKKNEPFSYDHYMQATGVKTKKGNNDKLGDAIHTVDGRRVKGQPQRRGVYIKGHRKTVAGNR